jgi:hypothetical protein
MLQIPQPYIPFTLVGHIRIPGRGVERFEVLLKKTTNCSPNHWLGRLEVDDWIFIAQLYASEYPHLEPGYLTFDYIQKVVREGEPVELEKMGGRQHITPKQHQHLVMYGDLTPVFNLISANVHVLEDE